MPPFSARRHRRREFYPVDSSPAKPDLMVSSIWLLACNILYGSPNAGIVIPKRRRGKGKSNNRFIRDIHLNKRPTLQSMKNGFRFLGLARRCRHGNPLSSVPVAVGQPPPTFRIARKSAESYVTRHVRNKSITIHTPSQGQREMKQSKKCAERPSEKFPFCFGAVLPDVTGRSSAINDLTPGLEDLRYNNCSCCFFIENRPDE